MAQAFLQAALPVLYVYDRDAIPTEAPGFDMSLLPVVSRALKVNAGTEQVTVITGGPVPLDGLAEACTRLALQYGELVRATPEASNLIAAEFVADHFDAEAVLEHLQRIVEERRKASEVRLREGAGGEEGHEARVEPGGEAGDEAGDEGGGPPEP